MKRIAALCALAIAMTPLINLPATAAERPTTVEGCAKPTAKTRIPGTLKQPQSVDKKLATTMTITTNCGVITIAMNPAAPQTVTNMSALARARYFDKTYCHRLTTAGILFSNAVTHLRKAVALLDLGRTMMMRTYLRAKELLILQEPLLWLTPDQIPMAANSSWYIKTLLYQPNIRSGARSPAVCLYS